LPIRTNYQIAPDGGMHIFKMKMSHNLVTK